MATGADRALDYRTPSEGASPNCSDRRRRRLWTWPLLALIYGPFLVLGLMTLVEWIWTRFHLDGSGNSGEFGIVLGMWGFGIWLCCPIAAFIAALRRSRRC
jgi:hypothetical protein